MSCNAEFGIIESFDAGKDYGNEYTPQKYDCISIDDDVINDWWSSLLRMNSYFHCYSRPETALARWGITIIPPESFDLFYDIVVNDTTEEYVNQTPPLLNLIKKAKAENKHIIHYGI